MHHLINLLQSELGKDCVFFDEETRRACAQDESEQPPVLPDIVVIPETSLQVEILLRLAQEHRFFVTPRGAGTGKSGGAVPIHKGVLLSLSRMNHVLDLDTDNLLAVVEPGVICQDLQQTAWNAGLFYPPDPASLDTCSVGGNVAENAGGPRAFRYGVTREYVLGMEVVTLGGKRFDVGHRSVKGVSGYDLVGLLVGSEGTLAVFTKIIFKLIPQPMSSALFVLYFENVHQAAKTVSHLVRQRIFPMTLELMDAESIAAVRSDTFDPPFEAKAVLFLEIENADSNVVTRTVQNIPIDCTPIGIEMREGANAEWAWSARREVSKKLKARYAYKISEDVAVPRALLPELVELVRDIAADWGLQSACYGHAGDGNLHVNFLTHDSHAAERFERAVEELFRCTLLLGGTLSGEHGIGTLKQRFLPAEHAPAAMNMFATMKRAWDPYGLLNPGKIL